RSANKFFMESIEHHEGSLNHYSSDDTMSNLGAKELISLIQKLPPKCQIVFNLYVFEGLKHREIADQLGITEGTSKSNLSDARAILQKALNKSNQPAVASAPSVQTDERRLKTAGLY